MLQNGIQNIISGLHVINFVQVLCQLCNYKLFVQLKTHIRCHSGAKPYKCSVCDKSFPHNNTLKNHLRRHYNDRQYSCEYCSKNFIDRTALVRHSRTHTGIEFVFLFLPYSINQTRFIYIYFFQEKNHISVMCVIKILLQLQILTSTKK